MLEQIGRYKILSELGRGAMGVVYKAQDTTIGRMVAVKTIRMSDLAHPEERDQLRSRLFREAQSAGILSHPGIVTIYDIAEEADLAYITMEFVEGKTLEKLLDQGSLEDAKYLVSVATQTALALDYAHSKGIVHRDIKPGNIMVNNEGQVKITDFGIARIASSKFTHTGTVMGTPSYMSPEQVRGAVVDGRSDMFSLSVVLYEMLTGQKPFSGDSITTVIFKIVSENPVPPKELNPSVGSKVNTVVMRALAKEPAERYQNCKEFAEALQLAVAQTANLTPLTKKVLSDYEATLASDPNMMTQADRPSAPAAPPPPQAPVAVEPTQRKLPPLEGKPAPAPVSAQAAAPAPPPPLAVPRAAPRRRTGLALVLAVLLGVAGGGIYWQVTRQQGVPSQPPARPSAEPSAVPPATASPTPPVEKPSAEPASAPVAAPPVSPPASETQAAPKTKAVPGTGVSPEKQTPPKALVAGGRIINTVTSEPGARVVADGNEATACTTPCSIPVGGGRHNLVFTRPGYHPEMRDVTMGREPVDVQVALRAIQATVMLSTVPAGASITVDGQAVDGATPKTLKLPFGKHLIAVAKQGFSPAQQTVEVTEDAILPVRIALPEP